MNFRAFHKFSLNTPWQNIRGVDLQFHTFLTLALGTGEWVITPQPIHSQERTPLPT